MNEEDQYMADFMTVFQRLDRWGPGSDADSLQALSRLPAPPASIVDIGCGKGFSTRLLARHTDAHIVAIDNDQSALDELSTRLAAEGLDAQVTLRCANMTELTFLSERVDCIWCEAAAYVVGVDQALNQWRSLLKDNGFMVVSDLVWLSDHPSPEIVEFWESEYPDMQTVDKRLTQMHQAGYKVIDHFTLSKQAWSDYYQPLKARIAEVKASLPGSVAIADLEREIAMYERHLGVFGYQMFVLQSAA